MERRQRKLDIPPWDQVAWIQNCPSYWLWLHLNFHFFYVRNRVVCVQEEPEGVTLSLIIIFWRGKSSSFHLAIALVNTGSAWRPLFHSAGSESAGVRALDGFRPDKPTINWRHWSGKRTQHPKLLSCRWTHQAALVWYLCSHVASWELRVWGCSVLRTYLTHIASQERTDIQNSKYIFFIKHKLFSHHHEVKS